MILELALEETESGRRQAFLQVVIAAASFYTLPIEMVVPEVSAETIAFEKALPVAHVSHYQQRSLGGRFAKRQPHHDIPRGPGGQFRQRLDESERAAAVVEAKGLLPQFASRLERHLGDLERGSITNPEWFGRCSEDVRLFYKLIYQCGKRAVGDPAVKLAPADMASINACVRDELGYLSHFGEDMQGRLGKMPYAQRMAMYGAAAREPFWRGFILGDQRPGRELAWLLGPTEHCKDCLRFNGMGWTPAAKFVRDVLGEGYAPQSGKLECLGFHCQCYIVEKVNGKKQPVVSLTGVV